MNTVTISTEEFKRLVKKSAQLEAIVTLANNYTGELDRIIRMMFSDDDKEEEG